MVNKTKKTKFTKSLAFKTMLRLFIIVIIVSLIASTVIGVYTFINLVAQMRDSTYEAALKGAALASMNEMSEEKSTTI